MEPVYSSSVPDYNKIIGYIDLFNNEYDIRDASYDSIAYIKDGAVIRYGSGETIAYLDYCGKVYSNSIKSDYDCLGFVDTNGKIYSTPYRDDNYCIGYVDESLRSVAGAVIPLLLSDCKRKETYTSTYNGGGGYGSRHKKAETYEEIIKRNERINRNNKISKYIFVAFIVIMDLLLLYQVVFYILPKIRH